MSPNLHDVSGETHVFILGTFKLKYSFFGRTVKEVGTLTSHQPLMLNIMLKGFEYEFEHLVMHLEHLFASGLIVVS